ncbi:threonine ammonia-lyase [Terrihabitans sp. B22-R8]|uniref:threonine ammonia-lyase n=1 Tax=Terrihabitans sp. B22-R8 TaxID=3425128 RepID=UPI00403CDE53
MALPHDTTAPMPVSLADIRKAQDALVGQAVRTPTLPAPKLSALTGAEVWVKYENMQVTNSFKDRGAYVRMSRLDEAQRKTGVITMSAGNHAQAVAYHAQRLGIPATIVMPEQTPQVKVRSTEAFGAQVVLCGETLAESQIRALEIAEAEGLCLIHPYDDPDIIAGQGTAALEMLEDAPEIDVLIVPIGGGGLISGMAIAAKAINPEIEIVGVESALYPSMINAMQGLPKPAGGPTLAEGIAVKNVGKLTLPVVEALIEEVLLVSESDLERAVNAFAAHQKTMAEGAGAAGLAAMLAHPERFEGRKVGLILCGGNIDPRILASIMVRELERESRIAAFRLTINDTPGVLGRIATKLGELGANILEVEHSRVFLNVPAKGATLDITVETRDAAHARQVHEALNGFEGIPCRRIDAGGQQISL